MNASTGGQPRGGSPPASRPQVTISDDDRERIEKRLTDLPLDEGSLSLAMQQFGQNFDLVALRQSVEREDEDPVERNKVRLIKSNLQALIVTWSNWPASASR